MASSRGHGPPGSSRQKLKQRLARTPGMLLVHEEEPEREGVVHRTSSATRNFFGSISGLRQIASKGPRSWLVRDTSLPAYMDGLDMGSNASSFGSVSTFGSRFGSTVDLAGLIGLEDLAVTGPPLEVGSQVSHSIICRNQIENDMQQNFGEEHASLDRTNLQRNGDSEQFAVDGLVSNSDGVNELDRHLVATEVHENLNEHTGILKQQNLETRKQEHAAVAIQSAFRGFRARSSLKSVRTAVVTIQTVYRGFLARKLYRERVLKSEGENRAMLARRRYRKLYNTVIIVQKLWTSAKRQQMKAREQAALSIQSFYRGWLVRRFYSMTIQTIVKLQAHVRMRQAQKRYLELYGTVMFLQRTRRSLTLQRSAILMAMQERSLKIALQWKRSQELAALRIQTAFRGWLARKCYNLEVGKVLILQACARRNKAMKQFKQFKQLRTSAALTIQRAWRRYKTRQFQLRNEKIDGAAVRIQSVYRSWLARKKYIKELERVVFLQACVRRSLSAKKLRKLQTSVCSIQRLWRAYQARESQLSREKQVLSALKIQSVYRGHLARKQYILEIKRVVKLQACIRRNNARRQHGKLCSSVLRIQRDWRAYQRRLLQTQTIEQEHAAVRIQSHFRGWIARERYKVEVRRVVKVQACERSRRALKSYVGLQRAAMRERKERERAALRIQSAYRGWRARRNYCREVEYVLKVQACVRRRQEGNRYRQLHDAVLKIEGLWRAKRQHQQNVRRELESWAAVRIQSAYRGWVCWKKFKVDVGRVVYLQAFARKCQAFRQYQQLQKTVLILQGRWRAAKKWQFQVKSKLREHAAVKIQSTYRGWLVRKYYSALITTVVKLQTCVRSVRVRRQYQCLCRAVLLVQRQWKAGRLQRGQLQKEKQEHAAIRIQSWWRGHHQRELLLELQLQHESVTIIQRRWRSVKLLRSLRLEKWLKEQAAIYIQAGLRGHKVRREVRLSHHAAVLIQSAYRSFICRRMYEKNRQRIMLIQHSWRMLKKSTELLQEYPQPVSSFVENETLDINTSAKENLIEIVHSQRLQRNITLASSSSTSAESLEAAGYSGSIETESRGSAPGRSASPSSEDWNDVHIEELDRCLDTCLVVLPLASSSSRQLSLSFDFESPPPSMNDLEDAQITGILSTEAEFSELEEVQTLGDEHPDAADGILPMEISRIVQDKQTGCVGGSQPLEPYMGDPQECLYSQVIMVYCFTFHT